MGDVIGQIGRRGDVAAQARTRPAEVHVVAAAGLLKESHHGHDLAFSQVHRGRMLAGVLVPFAHGAPAVDVRNFNGVFHVLVLADVEHAVVVAGVMELVGAGFRDGDPAIELGYVVVPRAAESGRFLNDFKVRHRNRIDEIFEEIDDSLTAVADARPPFLPHHCG